MQRPLVWLTLLALVLGYAVLHSGGVLPQHWNACLWALGAIAVMFRAPRFAKAGTKPIERNLLLAALALLAFVALQLIPLPDSVLRIVSPARAELMANLGPVVPELGYATISVLPSATLPHFMRLCAYLVVLLLVAELARAYSKRPWVLVVPIIIIAALEAALGLLQYSQNGPEAAVSGTYVNRNHFAGLLEMALPFAAVYPLAAMRRGRSRRGSSARSAFRAGVALTAAALILIGVLLSLSRMGFIASLFSLVVMSLLAFGGMVPSQWWSSWWKKATALGLLAAVTVVVFLFLPPGRLVHRFAELSSSDEITADGRLSLWSESLNLIRDYPLVGCGLGGYRAAFLKYKESAPMKSDDYAHNDYIQLMAELGLIGFLLAAILVLSLFARAIRISRRHPRSDFRFLGLACAGSMAAILLHSLVDFNLYIPANGLLLVWVFGVSAGLPWPAREKHLIYESQRERVIEVEPQPV